ncbi:ABC transporter ATP-binding protein [Dethiobacter alkaliphilus]|uniref:ABC transporter ATP-binding protein n=1 Tax=Dethiobacter alkaliphilus TaxID=427926 RepID=UPI002225FC78|nr:ABC transporter ATP-binding protein [Dethiobacter alkaliphilus]MCW3489048.1 ABC transporter ATP-binding protein [Dethiobacter alkaliphilus]
MNVVECSSLTKTYGNINALNKLSFAIEENKITGLIGPNGAGKTTLLKIMAGFMQQSSGEIKVFDRSPFNDLAVSANMIFVDDNMALPQTLSLADILDGVAPFYANWDAGLAQRLFAYFNLQPGQYHHKLSKGMKSTFNMIIGIAARCPLTLFDEPTTGMDAGVRKDFYRALLKDYLAHPRTIILSSHLLNEIQDVLEDVLLMRAGEKRLHLPVSDLKEYAVGLRGRREVLEQFSGNREVLYREALGRDSVYLVVQNTLSETERQQARRSGVEILPVDTADLCVYLTATNKGGIDDVFSGA